MEVPGPKEFKYTLPQAGESLPISRVAALRREIDALDGQRRPKEEELRRLQIEPRSLFDAAGCADHPATILSPEEKIALFLSLFGARRDVYARFWENTQSGKKGYSPAYVTDYEAGAFGKRYLPLAESVVEQHLRGHQAIGVYALRNDDSCSFLAADFDGEGWQENVLAYKKAAEKSGVAAGIERSRSGNGAHAWIFFAEPVPAVLARCLGTILLAKASAMRPTMSLGALTSTAAGCRNPTAPW